jgi:hypothetical protein
MNILYTIIGIIVLAIVVYLVITYIRGSSQIQNLATQQFSLVTPKAVLDTDSVKDILLSPGAATICCFVNYRFGDRTSSAVPSQVPISLISIKGALDFVVSPTSAFLEITTKGPTQSTEIETVTLPPLPQQKWIFIAILRDGRRYDIIYNDQIVASHRTAFFPVIAHNSLTIGNTKLLGQAINVLVAPYRLTMTQALQQRAALADTNGQPTGASQDQGQQLGSLPFTAISAECLPGIPCKPVSRPPKNTLKAWSSPYQ